MATKKQKRAAGLAKREKFLAEVKESGLKAQKDPEYRAGLIEKETVFEQKAQEFTNQVLKKDEELCKIAHEFAKAFYIGGDN